VALSLRPESQGMDAVQINSIKFNGSIYSQSQAVLDAGYSYA